MEWWDACEGVDRSEVSKFVSRVSADELGELCDEVSL